MASSLVNSKVFEPSRRLKTSLKEHLLKCVISYISDKKDKKSVVVKSVMKKSAMAEHLANNTCCENNFDISKFNIMRQCSNNKELIRLKAILIHLNKANLCYKKEFGYTLALFIKSHFVIV